MNTPDDASDTAINRLWEGGPQLPSEVPGDSGVTVRVRSSIQLAHLERTLGLGGFALYRDHETGQMNIVERWRLDALRRARAHESLLARMSPDEREQLKAGETARQRAVQSGTVRES